MTEGKPSDEVSASEDRLTRLHPRVVARLIYMPDGCLVWAGATDRGYGKVNLSDRNHRVHRLVYEHLVAPVGAGLVLDHLCRNKACANPAHLEPVTQLENMRRHFALVKSVA